MPKIKTKRAAAKRFARTGGGKIRRRHAFGRHLLTHKSRKRKRSYKGVSTIHSTDEGRVRQMLPYIAG